MMVDSVSDIYNENTNKIYYIALVSLNQVIFIVYFD